MLILKRPPPSAPHCETPAALVCHIKEGIYHYTHTLEKPHIWEMRYCGLGRNDHARQRSRLTDRTPDWKTDSLMGAGTGVFCVAVLSTSSVGSDFIDIGGSSIDSKGDVALVVTIALAAMSCTVS